MGQSSSPATIPPELGPTEGTSSWRGSRATRGWRHRPQIVTGREPACCALATEIEARRGRESEGERANGVHGEDGRITLDACVSSRRRREAGVAGGEEVSW